MSTKPGWAALQENRVACRPCQLASQRHKRTCFGLLVTSGVDITTPSSITHAGHTPTLRPGKKIPLSPPRVAAFSAPALGSDPSAAASCLSMLNEARCANREVPGRCWLMLHGVAVQGWRGQNWDGSSTSSMLCPSWHPWVSLHPWVSWPGSGGRNSVCPTGRDPRGWGH